MPKNIIIDYIVKKGIPLTVQNYISINYFGDRITFEDLEAEDRSEVLGWWKKD